MELSKFQKWFNQHFIRKDISEEEWKKIRNWRMIRGLLGLILLPIGGLFLLYKGIVEKNYDIIGLVIIILMIFIFLIWATIMMKRLSNKR